MPRAKQRTPELRDHLLEVAAGRWPRRASRDSRRVGWPSGPARRCRRSTSCSSTRPDWCARCSSRASGCWGPSWPRCPRPRIRWPISSVWCRVPVGLPGVSEAGAGDVLAALRRFRARARRVGGRRVGAEVFIGRIQRCVEPGLLSGDVADIAQAPLALAQGLAVQDPGRWLGPSGPWVERRWRLWAQSLLAGLRRVPVYGLLRNRAQTPYSRRAGLQWVNRVEFPASVAS